MFYLIIAGSRTFDDYNLLKRRVDEFLENESEVTIISGHASGADKLGEKYAKEKVYELITVPADWGLYGKRAGYLRNRKMHEIAATHKNRACICFWDGESKGTAQNFKLAKEFNTRLKIIGF